MEDVEILHLFTFTDKLDWLASNGSNRHGRPTTSIAIQLGQDDPRDVQLVVKALRRFDRVLTSHGINNQQNFVWLNQLLDVDQLIHQLFVNLQPPSRIDDYIVVMILLGLCHPVSNDINGIFFGSFFKYRHANLVSNLLQLRNCGWSVNIGRDKHWSGVFFVFQTQCQLTGRRRFTGTLQPDHHNYGWNVRCFIQRDGFLTHQLG